MPRLFITLNRENVTTTNSYERFITAFNAGQLNEAERHINLAIQLANPQNFHDAECYRELARFNLAIMLDEPNRQNGDWFKTNVEDQFWRSYDIHKQLPDSEAAKRDLSFLYVMRCYKTSCVNLKGKAPADYYFEQVNTIYAEANSPIPASVQNHPAHMEEHAKLNGYISLSTTPYMNNSNAPGLPIADPDEKIRLFKREDSTRPRKRSVTGCLPNGELTPVFKR